MIIGLFLFMRFTILEVFHNLSLNIVLGACISSLSIARFLNVEIPFSVILCLGLTVWLIYTADHLWDACRLPEFALLGRHVFHQLYFKRIMSLAAIALALLTALVFQLPFRIIVMGLLASAFVLFYFFTFKKLTTRIAFYKEGLISIGYAFGIFISGIGFLDGNLKPELAILFSQYFLLAFLNVLIISVIDHSADFKEGSPSSFIVYGLSKTYKAIKTAFLLFIFLFVVSVICFFSFNFLLYQAILLLMAATLLFVYQKALNKPHLAHPLTDLIFLYPALYMMVN